MDSQKLAAILVEHVTTSGGCTLTRLGALKTHGICRAVDKKYEAQCKTMFQPAVAQWVRRVWPDLSNNLYWCLGARLDPSEGVIYLDVVDVFPDVQLTHALRLAKEQGQKAIYHLETGTTLRLE